MSSIIPDDQLSPEQAMEDHSHQLVVTIIVAFAVESVAVAARILARRIQSTPWMWGDFLVPLAWLFNIGLLISSIFAIKLGDVGKHIQVVPFENIKHFLIITHYPMPVLYAFTSSLPKIAVLEVYVRFFVLDRIPRYISYFTGLIIVLNVVINIPLALAACQPFQYVWDPNVEGHCLDTQKLYLWATFPNILTDGIMFLLPLPLVFRLQSSRRVKWGIFTTFVVGSVGIIFSVIRFRAFEKPWTDGTWVAIPTLIATIVEPGVYLLAACFLTYRPLFRYIAKDTFLEPVFRRLSTAATAVMSSVSSHGHSKSAALSKDGGIHGLKFGRYSATSLNSWNGSTAPLEPVRNTAPRFDDDADSYHSWRQQSAESGFNNYDGFNSQHGRHSRSDSYSLRSINTQSTWSSMAQAPLSPPERDARLKDVEGQRAMSVGDVSIMRGLSAGTAANHATRRVSVAV